MDLNTVRTMNVVGTVLFGVLTLLAPVVGFFWMGMMLFWIPDTSFFILCMTGVVAWIIIFGFVTYLMYKNTVVSLDIRDFELAKRWTLYGVVMGVVFGLMFTPGFLIFIPYLVAYIGLEEELRPKYWGYPQYPYYPPPPPQYPYGPPPGNPPYPHQHYPPSIGIKGQEPVIGIKQEPIPPPYRPAVQPPAPAREQVRYAVKEKKQGKPNNK